MKIVSFNVNGIRARIHQLEKLIDKHSPDIIGLQETKVDNENFPLETIKNLGYEVIINGQKGHYGVCLMSKNKPINHGIGMPTDPEDAQCRLVWLEYKTKKGPLFVFNGYFPQGESRDHPIKFPYKEKFYKDLINYLKKDFDPESHLIVMGDLNISPEDIDIGIGENNRKRWLQTGKCSFLPEEREWLENLKDFGLYDSYRCLYPEENNTFSWFDYRSRGFDDNPKRGLRIDHLWVTKSLKDLISYSEIDYEIRGMEKPSDHAPVWTKFNI